MRLTRLLLFVLLSISCISCISRATDTADLTASEARQALSAEAKNKLEAHSLQTFTNQSTNEFIVIVRETQAERVRTDPGFTKGTSEFLSSLQRSYDADKSDAFRDMNGATFHVLQNYETLPMAFVRTTTRRSFVRLLNNNQVLRVWENDPHGVLWTQ